MNVQLTPAKGQEIINALKELSVLNGKKIVEKGDDEKRSALTSFASSALLAHGPELMGCWIAVREEYEPLVVGFAGLFARASNILNAREKKD